MNSRASDADHAAGKKAAARLTDACVVALTVAAALADGLDKTRPVPSTSTFRRVSALVSSSRRAGPEHWRAAAELEAATATIESANDASSDSVCAFLLKRAGSIASSPATLTRGVVRRRRPRRRGVIVRGDVSARRRARDGRDDPPGGLRVDVRGGADRRVRRGRARVGAARARRGRRARRVRVSQTRRRGRAGIILRDFERARGDAIAVRDSNARGVRSTRQRLRRRRRARTRFRRRGVHTQRVAHRRNRRRRNRSEIERRRVGPNGHEILRVSSRGGALLTTVGGVRAPRRVSRAARPAASSRARVGTTRASPRRRRHAETPVRTRRRRRRRDVVGARGGCVGVHRRARRRGSARGCRRDARARCGC